MQLSQNTAGTTGTFFPFSGTLPVILQIVVFLSCGETGVMLKQHLYSIHKFLILEDTTTFLGGLLWTCFTGQPI